MTIIRTVDFETTAKAPPGEVVEVGICDLVLEESRVCHAHSWLRGCTGPMPPDVRAVHHITLAELEGLPLFDAEQLIVKAQDDGVSAIAAHNIEFEMQWLPHRLPFICTYKAALRVWPHAPGHSNGVLRYWLEDEDQLHIEDRQLAMPPHRAGPDAYVTAHILKALFAAGATGKEMVAWTKEPKMLPRCPIGDWRDKPWADVDDGFLRWMLSKATMEEDLKWLARRELDRRYPPQPLPAMG